MIRGRAAYMPAVHGMPAVDRAVVMVVAMFATTRGTHPIARAPTAVIVAVRLVIAAVVSDAAFDADTGHGTCRQQAQRHATKTPHHRRQQPIARAHFGSSFGSLSLHSISPN